MYNDDSKGTAVYGAFKHGEPFLLPFCEKNLTSSVLMKKN